MKKLAYACLAVAFSGAPVFAHDMWIEPATFLAGAGDIVAVGLRVGQDLLGDRLPRDPALINQFIVVDAEGRKPVVGRSGSDPAGLVRAAMPGVMVIGYQSTASAVEQTSDKFNQYLKEEGLDAVAALRSTRGQTGAVRELFTRCAKSLVLSGPADKSQGDRTLGFTLELVAEHNPYTAPTDQELPFRLTYENRGLPGALVVAINRADPSRKVTARTDRDGRVRFRLKDDGMWLVKAVHMVPAPAGANAEWASYWASLTFQR